MGIRRFTPNAIQWTYSHYVATQENDMSGPIIWMTQRDLAAHLQINASTVWRHVQSGKLPPPHKLSFGVARYYRPEVDKFLRGK